MIFVTVFSLLLGFQTSAFAQSEIEASSTSQTPTCPLTSAEARVLAENAVVNPVEKLRMPIPASEKAFNFGIVYGAQWVFYLVSQNKEIREHGSFENWLQYPFRPHYDKDHFDYNLIKHSVTGAGYYLFYRSRGYTKAGSFIWSTLSSLAFEFTIETVTERPSFQDIYQTPVFGTVFGIGLESLSEHLHATGTWYGRGLGYLVNPFSILNEDPALSGSFFLLPDRFVASVRWEF